jgi:hypothetical protein
MAKNTEQVMKPPRKTKEPKVLVPARVMNKEGAKGIIPVQPRKQHLASGKGGARRVVSLKQAVKK